MSDPPRLLDVDGLEAVLSPGGRLGDHIEGYEDRPEQREMLRFVAERYDEGGVGIVEAGTGTGKSLAYLLPALSWASRNGERTVLSTNTINLQEQLIRADLPIARELLDEEVEWALVKGRHNYVSIRRARLAAASAPDLFVEDRGAEMKRILDWIDATEDGSRSDLPFEPSPEAWEEVRSDTDICLRSQCPHYQECFYQRSRRAASSAKVLVVNHHLLFTDLAVRADSGDFDAPAVLPPYRRVILDEAHNIEDAATAHLGAELTRRSVLRPFARLEGAGGKGVLAALERSFAGARSGGEAEALRARIRDRIRPTLRRARRRAVAFLDALEPSLPARPNRPRRIGRGEGDLPEPLERAEVRTTLEALLGAVADLVRELEELHARIDMDEAWGERMEGRLLDLASVGRRLVRLGAGLRLVLDPGEEAAGYVRWMERRGSNTAGLDPRASAGPWTESGAAPSARSRLPGKAPGDLLLAAAPVEVGGFLNATLLQEMDTVLFTSATLATRGRFDFLRERLGLGEGVAEVLLPSPFDHRSQSRLCVPTDLPDLRRAEDSFLAAAAGIVREVADLTGGGVFVLFTSHRALRRVAELLREDREANRWPLFVQGEGSRSRLLSSFTRSGDAILLGTASFWEGVDVRGRALRALILQKLPFKVPTEPVTAARVEAVRALGRDPFWSYLLPQAALRLKQGFGRLIRSRSDRGAVLLLDDRILRRRYGRYFRGSLPPAPLVKGLWPDVRRRLRDFYGAPEARG